MTFYMPIFRSLTNSRTVTQLHAHLLVTGLYKDALASTKLIESYAKLGSLESARLVFDTFPRPDTFMWCVLIKSYVWNLFFKEAISLYHEMLYQQIDLSSFIFPSILKACSGCGDVGMGRKIHGRIIRSGLESDSVVQTSLLCMYGERGCLVDARMVFDGLTKRDVISWSSIISSYVQNGGAHEVMEIFPQMILEGIEPDSVTMLSVTGACADLGFARVSKSIHGYIVRRRMEDDKLENSLIFMYSKCGELDSAERLFRNFSCWSTVSWTAMISCCNQMTLFREALEIFIEMQEYGLDPNSVTMVGVLCSCTQLGWLKEGKSVHCFVIRKGLDFDFVGPALMDMYAVCGRIRDCQKVFDSIQEKDIISWNSLISVYTEKGMFKEALRHFVELHGQGVSPDSFTLSSSLSACADICFAQLGHQIHCHIIKTGFGSNEFVWNSLIGMHSKCGFIDTAYTIFESVQNRSVVTWNCMIGGLAQNGNSVEAINLFDEMYSKGLKLDKVTFLSVIHACSHLGYLEKGKWIHQKLITYGLRKDYHLDTALTDMYAKCGDLHMARGIFDSMLERSVVSWSAMIAGYGQHGHVDSAISLFSQMVNSGIKPNDVTFMNILSACSHGGAVQEGNHYFSLMRRDFNIEPKLEHFGCMVDLLSRSGDLDEAYRIIKSMPIPPDASIWGALLNGCRVHRRTHMIRSIQRSILDLGNDNLGYYILLSNIYAEGRNWNEYGNVRAMLKNMGLRKMPGYSTIEIHKRIYRFGSGDRSHSQTKEIYRSLKDLTNMAEEQESVGN